MALLTKKALLDTNILIDICDPARPGYKDAAKLLKACANKRKRTLIACVSSLKDAYYILCKQYANERAARMDIDRLFDLLDVVDLTSRHARVALDSNEPDFEDGLVRAVAESHNVAAIVTRDARAFAGSNIPCMDARAYLKKIVEQS